MNGRAYWEGVYRQKKSEELSWYRSNPEMSMDLIQATGAGKEARILDVGGGTAFLVDRLLGLGFTRLGVLDLSITALRESQHRLGGAAGSVEWVEADILNYRPSHPWDVWHDRAVFHFMVDRADRVRYCESLYRSVPEGGHVIIATFGPEGPTRCSGLDTLRYTAEDIARELGSGVRLVEDRTEEHETPSGAIQQFVYARLLRLPGALP